MTHLVFIFILSLVVLKGGDVKRKGLLRAAVFFTIFLFFIFPTDLWAQNGEVAQEPIKKVDTPNDSPIIVVQVVRGYLIRVTDDERLILKIDSYEREVFIRDVKLVYKYYDKNLINHHKAAGIGAGIAGGGVAAVEVLDKEEMDKKEFFKDAGIASAAGYVVVYFGSRLFESLRERGEIPDRLILYSSNAGKDENPQGLVKKFQQLETNSYLELILKD